MGSIYHEKLLSAQNKKYIPRPYREMARNMEKQFLQLMIKEMNKTINSSEMPSTSTNYYRQLLNTQRADKMSKNRGGMGIQDLILDQIYPRHRRNPLAYEAYLKALEIQKEKQLQGQNKRIKIGGKPLSNKN